ncbi:MAG: acetylornithine/succinylornithine family transaminase [Christensenellales bacterium]
MNTKQIDKEYIANTYNRFGVEIRRGKGSEVWDETGKRYIDLGSGIGVTAFGYCDDEWMRAVAEQLACFQHASNLYYTKPCAELACLLCQKTDMKKVFFSNSGAEANECAIKVARKYAQSKKGEEYYNIVTLNNSFHGRTLTTLAATGQEHYHQLFKPLTGGFLHTDAGDLDMLSKCVEDNKVAGILIEIVQGEGGVNRLEKDFVLGVEKIAKDNDIVLMIDEVQTGNGRSGQLYAYMEYGIKPDVVSTAKGLGGGLPIGATILGEKVADVLGYGEHGSTFGGNPIACAGALSILKRIDEELLRQVRQKSRYVWAKLQNAKGIESVSGMGLMIGIKTAKPAREVVEKCLERGVLCLTAKDKVRLLPALNIEQDLLDEALNVLLEIVGK